MNLRIISFIIFSVLLVGCSQFQGKSVFCLPNWQCSEFSECTAGARCKTCDDLNKCDNYNLIKMRCEGCGKVVANIPSVVNDPSSALYRPEGNRVDNPVSQIYVVSGESSVDVYYEGQFQGTTAPMDHDQFGNPTDDFGYKIDRLVDRLDDGTRYVIVGNHNLYLVKNGQVVFNENIYVGKQNSTSRGEWIYYRENQ